MTTKIVYLPKSTHIKLALEETIKRLSAQVMHSGGEPLSAVQIMPLVEAVDQLTDVAGKVEAMTLLFEYRVSAFEAALQTGAAKPASDFASQLDQRMKATAALLSATLDRLDQVEEAVLKLYKPPFLAIDEHDQARKELAQLRAKFEVACPEA